MFEAMEEARRRQHYVSIVLNSALTDMAALMRDPRWEEIAPSTVKYVVVMGGVIRGEGGAFQVDPSAANSTFDWPSAKYAARARA